MVVERCKIVLIDIADDVDVDVGVRQELRQQIRQQIRQKFSAKSPMQERFNCEQLKANLLIDHSFRLTHRSSYMPRGGELAHSLHTMPISFQS